MRLFALGMIAGIVATVAVLSWVCFAAMLPEKKKTPSRG